MKHPSAYLKMKVMGAIDYASGNTTRERIKSVAQQSFLDENAKPRTFTWRTISTWFYRYKANGITSVEPKTRSDKGKTRKMTPEDLMEVINQAKVHFRDKKYNKTEIYRYCIKKGLLQRNILAPTTYYRWVKDYEMLKDVPQNSKLRLAFAMQYANQLWQADTMFGPYVTGPKGKPVQTKLIAFIDDASRLICHGEFFINENTDALVNATRSAFFKRGVPEQLYVDNGSIYCCQEITLICARVGCILRHAPVRDGAAKGKIERFFGGLRARFLTRKLDLSSVAALNRQFHQWVEEDYNNQKHDTIGMKPLDRFAFDIKRVRFLAPSESTDELFYAQAQRKVKKDNTFSFLSKRYEAPCDARGRHIDIRYSRVADSDIIVYYKDQRMGVAKPVNLIANANFKRKRAKD